MNDMTFGSGLVSGLVYLSIALTAGGLCLLLGLLARDLMKGNLW